MSDTIRKLARGEIALNGEVEATIQSGSHTGERYAVRPKPHNTCHATGRVLGEYVPAIKQRRSSVCQCVDGPIRRATNTRPQDPITYELDSDTEESRRAYWSARLTAEKDAAQKALEDLEQRAVADVQRYHEQATADEKRAERLADGLQELVAKRDYQQRLLDEAKKARAEAEEAFKRAKQVLVCQESDARQALEALTAAQKQVEALHQNAAALRREAARVRERAWDNRIAGARRARDGIAADLARLEIQREPEPPAPVVDAPAGA